ncbi:hypothetical protein [Paenibacillus vulneris]|uniref:Uncharacterized protein n=1 Tax=Paenibacillus vulneris TaxID=1133364 RepID=A0ABW3USM6_9BACL
MDVEYALEEFTSTFETRENIAKSNPISRVSTVAEGAYPTGVLLLMFKLYKFFNRPSSLNGCFFFSQRQAWRLL